MRILLLSLLVGATLLSSPSLGAEGKPSILVISGFGLNQLIDPTYLERMESDGYHLDSCLFKGLTWERISKFNVLVIQRVPPADIRDRLAWFHAAFPLLKRFLDEGGGILWLHDGWSRTLLLTANAFTADYGLETLPEFVFDLNPQHRFQQKGFMQRSFMSTTQIVSHPCTHGIDRVLLPAGKHSPAAISLSGDWQVLITGEDSAFSQFDETNAQTHSSRPPIFAVLELPKGRMAALPVMSSYTVQAGYHRTYEDIVLDKGNVYQLLRNTYDWLARPSLASGSLGGFVGPATVPQKIEQSYYNAYPMERQTADKRLYVGLIGARSNIAGGTDSVAEMCRAARKAGINFLVFTEPMRKMNKILWQQLSAECAHESWGDFVAIPGFEYTEPDGSTRICFNNTDWIADDMVNEEGFFRHPNKPLFTFGWPTVAYVDSHHPQQTPNSYHVARFFSAFGLFTYDGTRLIDDSVERYKVFTEDLYWSQPLAYHKMYSASDLVLAAKSNTYKTYVLAPSIGEVPEGMRRQRTEYDFGNSCFVSDGPVINNFRLVGGGWTIDPWENYFLWESGDTGTVTVDVSSDLPIKDVIVYRGQQIYWHFRPFAERFKLTLPYVFEQGDNLWMKVEDVGGRSAYSYSLMTRHNTWWSQMCADVQNILQTGMFPKEKGGIAFKGERRWPYGGMGWQFLTANSSMPGPAGTDDLFPNGLDACYQSFLYTTGVTAWIDGMAVTPRPSRLAFVHQTGSVSVMDSHGDLMVEQGTGYLEGFYDLILSEPDDFTFVSRRVASPPRRDGYDIQVVEQTVTFLRDVTLSEASSSLPLTLMTIGASHDSAPGFFRPRYRMVSYEANGKIEHVDRDKVVGPVLTRLDKSGGVCIYPKYYGSGAVYAVDNREYDLLITQDDVFIGLNEPGRTFEKGEILTARFVVVHEMNYHSDDTEMRAALSSYGVGSAPAYELTSSPQVIPDYYPTVVAKDHAAQIHISKAELANNLYLRVAELEGNWTAASYESPSKKLHRVGIFEGTAYVPVDTRQERDLFVGNVLTCGSAHVRLTLLESEPSTFSFQAHNLSDKPVTTVVESAGTKAGLPEFRRSVSLGPGELNTIDLEREGL